MPMERLRERYRNRHTERAGERNSKRSKQMNERAQNLPFDAFDMKNLLYDY